VHLKTDFVTYAHRLERVAAYIEAHLDERIDLLALAEVAHLSPYHFHRIYHAVSGETVAATVKRLRLRRAAAQLLRTSWSVAEVARGAGYSTVHSFTRIFKAEYGMPPAQYKRQGTHNKFQMPLESNASPHQEVNILEMPPMRGVALEHRGSYLMIERSFDKLFRWAKHADLQRDIKAILGVYDDDPFVTPEAQLRSRACLIFERDVTSCKAPLQTLEIPAGRCAVLRHRGPYVDMRFAYQWLYGHWLPSTRFEVADAPVFEIYLNHPRDTPATDALVDIYLPLKS
jgi:AraC family transcriptional regulator